MYLSIDIAKFQKVCKILHHLLCKSPEDEDVAKKRDEQRLRPKIALLAFFSMAQQRIEFFPSPFEDEFVEVKILMRWRKNKFIDTKVSGNEFMSAK